MKLKDLNWKNIYKYKTEDLESLFSGLSSKIDCEKESEDDILTYSFLILFLNKDLDLSSALMKLSKHYDNSSLDFKIKTHIVKSQHHWFNLEIDNALLELNKALRLQSEDYSDVIKVLFAQINLFTGNIYLAFEQINELIDDITISHWAKTEAAHAKSTYLLEVNQLQTLKGIENSLSDTNKARIKMHKEFANGETTTAQSLLIPDSSLHNCYKAGESNILCLVDLIIGYSILDRETFLSNVKNSWIKSQFHNQVDTGVYRQILELSEIVPPNNKPHKAPPTWLISIRSKMLTILSEVFYGDIREAFRIFSHEFSPELYQLRLQSIVLPYQQNGLWMPDTVLSQRLGDKLMLNKNAVHRTTALIIENRMLQYISNNINFEKDISKWSSSLTTLLLIAGPKGSYITNKQLHQALSQEEYSPSAHNKRIYKVLERLKNRLDSINIPQIWSRPGDGRIVLEIDIIIK